MNWSLSVGTQEWDCIVVHPSVVRPNDGDASREDMIRHLVRAQDLMLIDRAGDDRSGAQELVNRWIGAQSP